MIKKLSSMKIKQRLNFGYIVVIVLMIISGLFSMISLGILNGSLNDFVNGSNRADTAVKICRIDVNIAARSIREMALNDDVSSYDGYRQKVEERMEDIGIELEALKATGLIDAELCQRYADALNSWGTVGYAIMNKIETGDQEGAIEEILTKCTPALDEVIAIGEEIDVVTDELMQKSINASQITFFIAIICIVAFIILAVVMALRIGKIIVASITDPLYEIEKVAQELTEGNLHSHLEYHSEDEIGRLAHSLRKSIRILASYVDDIADSMKEFSAGNFAVQPLVEWKGDFVTILIVLCNLRKIWQRPLQVFRMLRNR